MNASEPLLVNVVSMNVLLDKTRSNELGTVLPQDDRILSAAASLNAFAGSLDIVSVQEAFKSEYQHNGEVLAEACGLGSGQWVEHNTKPEDDPGSRTGRAGEHVGLFGELVECAEAIDIGGRRTALLSVVGGVAFVAAHLRAGRTLAARRERKEGALALVRATAQYDAAVLALDKNEFSIPWVAAGQRTLERAGFASAFKLDGKPSPRTFPTEDYKRVHGLKYELPLDDIMIRGDRVKVLGTGVIEHVIPPIVPAEKYVEAPKDPSDHRWPYATLRIDP